MRWGYFSFALLVAALLETRFIMVWGGAAPILLIIPPLAFTLRENPSTLLAAWWLAGVFRDLLIGPLPGANALIFLLCGMGVSILREHVDSRHFVGRIVLPLSASLFIGLSESLVHSVMEGLSPWHLLIMQPAASLLTVALCLILQPCLEPRLQPAT